MSETSPTITDLLRSITSAIDLDHAVMIADVINLYSLSLKRIANRSILGPDDAVKILTIINLLQQAAAGEPEPEIIPGMPTRP